MLSFLSTSSSEGGVWEFLSGVCGRLCALQQEVYHCVQVQILALAEEMREKQSLLFALLGSLFMVVVLAKVVLVWFRVSRTEEKAPLRRHGASVKEKQNKSQPDSARGEKRAVPSKPASASSSRSLPFPVVVKKEAERETTGRHPRLADRRQADLSEQRGRGRAEQDSSPQTRGRSRTAKEAKGKGREASRVRSLKGGVATAVRSSDSKAPRIAKSRRASADSELEEKVTTTRSGRVSKRTPLYPGIITWVGNRPVIDLTQD
ncbi:hypothetical protein TGGT1_259040 [Toxoplasma gondii GT1]|uniref:Transmembrane protein n=2 Tax=Toxoplasma gondii TaxID=5811 RepID=S7W7C5_TOXGG|nr:hypothetical protein TGGT1_259040 [Toxoplasma gondii GT1]KAF4641287.1 hypothetical protein TGRH88_070970 [Toxoplasma gondii]